VIAKIEVRTYGEEWQALTEEQYAELAALGPFPEKKDQYWGQEILVDLSVVGPELARLNLKADLLPYSKNNMVVKLKDQINRLEQEQSLIKRSLDGSAVQVHVPNLGLMSINEVTHLDDCCTDFLQEHLDKGWRILAVCPPNAQRRPDYILGRAK
jgi:hypothetical protein